MNTTAGALAGQRIVVTGSSRGIGRAVALRLARLGAQLVIHGRSKSPELERTRADVHTLSGGCEALTADFSESRSLEPFVEACFAAERPVHAWIQVAGADVLTTELREAPWPERLNALWQIDVAAAAVLLYSSGQRMRDQKLGDSACSIVTIGWDQAEQGMAGEAGLVFGSTKAAVHGLTRSLAQTLAPEVRVNCVAPGWIRTAWGAAANDDWQRRAATESLAGRWGTVDDVAEAVAFLAGPASRFVSGQLLKVNGGWKQGRPEITDQTERVDGAG